MAEMLSRCGYRCDLCAARSDDPKVRQKMVEGWRKYFGYRNYTAENVRCDGCMNDGRLADKTCKARPCAIEKGHESCAHCDEFPCDKLRPLLCTHESLIDRFGDIPEEEYNLCMRMFVNVPRLLEIRKSIGKKR